MASRDPAPDVEAADAPPRPTAHPASEDSNSVKSAERTVRILETLAAAPAGLTLGELQAVTGYPRSSLHGLLRTLRKLRWIELDSSRSRYGVGPHALLAGTAYLDRDPAIPLASKALEALRAEIGHTVHFARLDDVNVIYLASRESVVSVRTVYRVGRKLPAHITALGQALLAELTAAEVDARLPAQLESRGPNSITDRDALHRELETVRQRGWAFEIEQGTPGVACVAAAVPYRIPATDAISCSMPVEVAADQDAVARIAGHVVAASAALAAELRRDGVR